MERNILRAQGGVYDPRGGRLRNTPPPYQVAAKSLGGGCGPRSRQRGEFFISQLED